MIFVLDFHSDIPIYMQIRNEIVRGIAQEEFVPGDKLPTIRSLAAEIGVNAMTVNKAYDLLKQEGYIITDRRRGAMVTQVYGKAGHVDERQRKQLQLIVHELRLNGMTKEHFMEMCSQMYEEE